MVVIFSETGARFFKPTTKLAEIRDFLYPGNLSVTKSRYPNSEKKIKSVKFSNNECKMRLTSLHDFYGS